jgi:photosystem II oxygen-evolving enhancer protein 3
VVYVAGGQPAVVRSPVDMAALGSQMAVQPSSSRKFLQPPRARYTMPPARAMPEGPTEAEMVVERRGLLNAIAFAAAASAAQAASAATPVDIKLGDQLTSPKMKGFDLIYEARDTDLTQAQRDGIVAARSSIPDTKARIQESKKRMEEKMPKLISQAYWTQAKELMRLQVGTLRFDLDTLASAKPREDKKIARIANDAFFNNVEKLDFQIRAKNIDKAKTAYSKAMESFDSALKNYA